MTGGVTIRIRRGNIEGDYIGATGRVGIKDGLPKRANAGVVSVRDGECRPVRRLNAGKGETDRKNEDRAQFEYERFHRQVG